MDLEKFVFNEFKEVVSLMNQEVRTFRRMKFIVLLGCAVLIGWLMSPNTAEAASKTVTMVIHHEEKSERTGETECIDDTEFTIFNVDKPFEILPDMDGETTDERKGRFAGGYFIGRIPEQDTWAPYSGPFVTATRKGVEGVTKEIKLERGHIYLVAQTSESLSEALPAVIQINSKTVPYFHLYPKSSRGWLPDTDWIFGDELPETVEPKPKKISTPQALLKNVLPKTGEEKAIWLSVLGLIIVLAVVRIQENRVASVVKVEKYDKKKK
jgi:LPXTG-motif cell wall-anchored protein